ncbi:MAG TPA: hypothetical protein PKE45_25560 [Caldilineaceae bacterium]|nr:hypothetical protein [Caldilineaceae bacterium]
MTATIRYEEVLHYLDPDNGGVDWRARELKCALALFTAPLTRLNWAASPDMLEKLAYHLDDNQRQWLTQLAEAANRRTDADLAAEISEETYHAQKEPRFGEQNPELMDLAFWKFMVRNRWTAWAARNQFDRAYQAYSAWLETIDFDQWLAETTENPEPSEAIATETNLDTSDKTADVPAKSTAAATERPEYKYGSAVWCFKRFGTSRTRLPDGREIYIAGEHEDFYDPDFYIYNDVIVIHPDLDIQIYGYPREVFRPTDFHSATLVQDASIYIIGSLGYYGTRQPGVTPVYRLDCQSYQIELIATTGDNPGWISRHQAEYVAARNAIKVTQGQVCISEEGKRQFRPNRRIYWLDLDTCQWSCGSKQK